jgi:hypothetical protein
MARVAESVVLRGDGIEHDRSTPVTERSYILCRFLLADGDRCHMEWATEFLGFT